MSTVLEIEAALRRLPRQDTWEIARWLLDHLAQSGGGDALSEGSPVGGGAPSAPASASVTLPDYAARRRRIFGDRVLPNMVLAAREAERW